MQVNINARDVNGHTPFYPAVMNNDGSMILALLDEKANANEGLKYALEKDKTQLFDLFLNHAARPGQQC